MGLLNIASSPQQELVQQQAKSDMVRLKATLLGTAGLPFSSLMVGLRYLSNNVYARQEWSPQQYFAAIAPGDDVLLCKICGLMLPALGNIFAVCAAPGSTPMAVPVIPPAGVTIDYSSGEVVVTGQTPMQIAQAALAPLVTAQGVAQTNFNSANSANQTAQATVRADQLAVQKATAAASANTDPTQTAALAAAVVTANSTLATDVGAAQTAAASQQAAQAALASANAAVTAAQQAVTAAGTLY